MVFMKISDRVEKTIYEHYRDGDIITGRDVWCKVNKNRDSMMFSAKQISSIMSRLDCVEIIESEKKEANRYVVHLKKSGKFYRYSSVM